MAFVLLVGCSNSKISNNYITISKYKGLEIKEVKKTNVTNDDVDTQIQNNLSATAASEEVTDRAVENGDIVNIEYSSDFSTIPYSTPIVIISSAWEKPCPYTIFTTAVLNGGATLFFTILSFVAFPINSDIYIAKGKEKVLENTWSEKNSDIL